MAQGFRAFHDGVDQTAALNTMSWLIAAALPQNLQKEYNVSLEKMLAYAEAHFQTPLGYEDKKQSGFFNIPEALVQATSVSVGKSWQMTRKLTIGFIFLCAVFLPGCHAPAWFKRSLDNNVYAITDGFPGKKGRRTPGNNGIDGTFFDELTVTILEVLGVWRAYGSSEDLPQKIIAAPMIAIMTIMNGGVALAFQPFNIIEILFRGFTEPPSAKHPINEERSLLIRGQEEVIRIGKIENPYLFDVAL